MKKISLILLAIVGIIILGYGNIYWQEQITQMTHQKEEPKDLEPQKEEPNVDLLEVNMEYVRNLPQEVIEKIELGIESQSPIQLALIARNESDWAQGLEEALVDVYGFDLWDIEIITYGNETITALLQDESLQNIQADVILFEGPFLNNNLEGPEWEIALEQLIQLINDWEEEEAVVMIQPPNPIYQGVHFPSQVELYKNYLLDQGYLYLDHWLEWPDFNSEDILPLLDLDENEDRRHVSEAGAELWQEYLIDLFITN